MEKEGVKKKLANNLIPDEFERSVLKKLKKKVKIVDKKEQKRASMYLNWANKYFSNYSEKLVEKGYFKTLDREIIKAGLPFVLKNYVAVILFTTLLSIIVSFFASIIFFALGIGGIIAPLSIFFFVPLLTFLFVYIYPSLETKSAESSINQELPFATIHMSAIAGAMIEPSKVFQIIIATKEYPHLSKEFTKIINDVNILGSDLISALRNSAFNCPSKKLSELLNGIATTINSGGNLPTFFNKRSETLLFDYRIEREKYTRSAETFMDIYISVVIAAPMIFMLLFMLMSVSGLGISLSPSTISVLMVLGIAVINVVFLMFLHLKQPSD